MEGELLPRLQDSFGCKINLINKYFPLVASKSTQALLLCDILGHFAKQVHQTAVKSCLFGRDEIDAVSEDEIYILPSLLPFDKETSGEESIL